MKLNHGFPIAVLLLLVGGCGGSGRGGNDSGQQPPTEHSQPPPTGGNADPPQPPPIDDAFFYAPAVLGAACDAEASRGDAVGGIWAGPPKRGGPGEMRLLVAETGEFRSISPDGRDQQIFGTFRAVDQGLASDDAVWAWVNGLTWLETEQAGVNLRGEVDEASNLTLRYEVDSNSGNGGTLSFASCNSVYTRDSSLALLTGTYVSGERMLAIDGQGEIFLQDGSCTGNGKVELIDSEFNMYRLELTVSACAGNEVHAIGSTFSGLAYLADSGPGFTGDVLEYSLTAVSNQHVVFWVDQVQR